MWSTRDKFIVTTSTGKSSKPRESGGLCYLHVVSPGPDLPDRWALYYAFRPLSLRSLTPLLGPPLHRLPVPKESEPVPGAPLPTRQGPLARAPERSGGGSLIALYRGPISLRLMSGVRE